MQETLTRLYVALPRLRDPATATGYAFTTMFRLAIDRSRRRSNHELPMDAPPDLHHHDRDPTGRLDLARALAALTPLERALVIARYVDDRPVDEVATMLGRTPSWVRTTSHRTLAKLRTSPALAEHLEAVH